MELDLDPSRCALFLDFDGTLAEIAPRPEAVAVADDLPILLEALGLVFGGALAVVSGRPIAEIDAFLSPAVLPASGLHGLEWRPHPRARVERTPVPEAIGVLRIALAALPWPPGVRIEDKDLTLAVHYREAPEAAPLVADRLAALTAAHPDLALLSGKMVLEVKPAGASKAAAVERFLAIRGFSDRTPVFVGDDLTDEDGMQAAMARGGIGVKVGEGESVADHRLPTVSAVHDWLRGLASGLQETH